MTATSTSTANAVLCYAGCDLQIHRLEYESGWCLLSTTKTTLRNWWEGLQATIPLWACRGWMMNQRSRILWRFASGKEDAEL